MTNLGLNSLVMDLSVKNIIIESLRLRGVPRLRRPKPARRGRIITIQPNYVRVYAQRKPTRKPGLVILIQEDGQLSQGAEAGHGFPESEALREAV